MYMYKDYNFFKRKKLIKNPNPKPYFYIKDTFIFYVIFNLDL